MRIVDRALDCIVWGIIAACFIFGFCITIFGTPAKAAEVPYAGVVTVHFQNDLGTGVRVDATHIVTAAHVVAGNPDDPIIATDDGRLPTQGHVVFFNPDQDIAIIETAPAADWSPLACGPVQVGDDVQIVGNPEGLGIFHSFGHVGRAASVIPQLEAQPIILLDATVAPGNSGGPVFNSVGEVVAIVQAVVNIPLDGQLPISVPVPITVASPSSVVCRDLQRIGTPLVIAHTSY